MLGVACADNIGVGCTHSQNRVNPAIFEKVRHSSLKQLNER